MLMKTSSPRPARKPLSRSKASNCVLINQCATPGLGSILARRYVAGIGQLLVALVGFGLFVAWFVQVMIKFYSLINDSSAEAKMSFRLMKIGVGIFAAAWIWSWFTSISVMREAKRNAEQELKAPPLLK